MAERRIAEGTEGKGVVCFISNYSWLDGLSFTGMRERYLEVFDRIWIDCLNGDKYKTGKLTPDGTARSERVLHGAEPRGHPGRHGRLRCWCGSAAHEPTAACAFATSGAASKLSELLARSAEGPRWP